MKREWLRKKVETTDELSLAADELREFGLDANVLQELLASGPTLEARKRWADFIQAIQPDDELWYYKSPKETWDSLAGCAGYAIVRGGEIVSTYNTMRS